MPIRTRAGGKQAEICGKRNGKRNGKTDGTADGEITVCAKYVGKRFFASIFEKGEKTA